ncbi:hypothetical protein HK098_007727 [Nowakowskiella sp. JEL0407]|nr:hypothetical protein HK098_007727 [Nowakowskiella sp. JEL0407]
MYIGEFDTPIDIGQFAMLEELVCEVSPSAISDDNLEKYPPFIRAIGLNFRFLKLLDLKIQFNAEILSALGEAFLGLNLLEIVRIQFYRIQVVYWENDDITGAIGILAGRFSYLKNLKTFELKDFQLIYWNDAILETLIPSLNRLPRLESVCIGNCGLLDLYLLHSLNHLKNLDYKLHLFSNTLVASAIKRCVSLIELNLTSHTITSQSAVLAFFNASITGKLPKNITFSLGQCSRTSVAELNIPLDVYNIEAFSFFMNEDFQDLFEKICVNLYSSPTLKRFAAFDIKSGCDEYIAKVISTSSTLEELRLMHLNSEILVYTISHSRILKRFTLEDSLNFFNEIQSIVKKDVVLEEIVLGVRSHGYEINELYELVRSVRSNSQSRVKRIMLRNINEGAKWVDLAEDLSEIWLEFTDTCVKLHVVEDCDSTALDVLQMWEAGELDIGRIVLTKASDAYIQKILGSKAYQSLMDRCVISFGFIVGDLCVYFV